MEQIALSYILMGAALSFLVTFFAIPVIIQVSELKKLYDVPDERKIHKTPVPSLGGLAIFIGFVMALLLTVNIAAPGGAPFQYYILAFLIIFFLGIKDDILILSPLKKILGQSAAAVILVVKGHLLITNLHGLLGIWEMGNLPSYLFTILVILAVVNAVNLIDGVDALAGGIGFASSLIMGFYFLLNGDGAHAVLGFTLAAAIVGFLCYNFPPARIFMGDTGSMLVGQVAVILVIHFIAVAPTFRVLPVASSPAVGFAIVLIPMLDMLRVFGLRIMHRRSPFSADRNHLHHVLLDKGLSHRSVSFSITGASVVFAGAAFLFRSANMNWLVFGLIAVFYGAFTVISLTGARQLKVVHNRAAEEVNPARGKKTATMVSLSYVNKEMAATAEEE